MNLKKGMIIFRAESGGQTGLGHLIRMASLSEEFKKEGKNTLFWVAENEVLAQQILSHSGHEFEVFRQEECTVPKKYLGDGNIFIVDGYKEVFAYTKNCNLSHDFLVCFDDYIHLEYYNAHIIINQNIGFSDAMYSNKTNNKVLAGERFVILRDEILNQKPSENGDKAGLRGLITLGGTDAKSVTVVFIDYLEKISHSPLPIKWFVMLPSLNETRDLIKQKVDESLLDIVCLENRNDFPMHLANADIIISAGGTTLYEINYLEKQSISLITHENHAAIVQNMQKAEACMSLDWYNKLDLAHFTEIFSLGMEKVKNRIKPPKLIDGLGKERVFAAIMKEYDVWKK